MAKITNQFIITAKRFAIMVHGDQKYGEEFPYAIHLQAVESVLIRFGITDEFLRAAAWLHDTLEDTGASIEDLTTFFGHAVSSLVASVTEPKGMPRRGRHHDTYPRIKAQPNGIILKLADRIANVEAGGKKIGMYRKEYADFKLALSDTSVMTKKLEEIRDQMWQHLDSLMAEIKV
jgi:(p)ppGpp synthase/HD superfamily hydrolase